MKSLLLPLAFCALLGACAAPMPVAPAYYVTTPVLVDPAGVPQYAYPPLYAYPYGYPYGYPYPYAYAPGWYDPFLFSGAFFCCSVVHPRVRRMHGMHGMHQGIGGQARGGHMSQGGRVGRGDRR